MDYDRVLADLRLERERLDKAIHAFESLQAAQPKRRGRPPKYLSSSGNQNRIPHADAPAEPPNPKIRTAAARPM